MCQMSDLDSVNRETTHLVIGDNCLNDASLESLSLSPLRYLREVTIGDNSLSRLKILSIEDLEALKKVTVGASSCYQDFETVDRTADYLLRLKNNPVLKEVKIGVISFAYFDRPLFENLFSLEKIEMGSMDPTVLSGNFYNALFSLTG